MEKVERNVFKATSRMEDFEVGEYADGFRGVLRAKNFVDDFTSYDSRLCLSEFVAGWNVCATYGKWFRN